MGFTDEPLQKRCLLPHLPAPKPPETDKLDARKYQSTCLQSIDVQIMESRHMNIIYHT